MFTICEHCSLTLEKTCSSKPEFQVSIDLAKQHNHTNIKEQIKFKTLIHKLLSKQTA